MERCYRPQRSWAKIMFLQASVILSTKGVCLSACWDTPPQEQTPLQEQTPQEQTPPRAETTHSRHSPLEQTPPLGADPPWEQTPSGADTPPCRSRHPLGAGPPPGKQTPAYGQRAAGTHPTGMHSCFRVRLYWCKSEHDFTFTCINSFSGGHFSMAIVMLTRDVLF